MAISSDEIRKRANSEYERERQHCELVMQEAKGRRDKQLALADWIDGLSGEPSSAGAGNASAVWQDLT